MPLKSNPKCVANPNKSRRHELIRGHQHWLRDRQQEDWPLVKGAINQSSKKWESGQVDPINRISAKLSQPANA